MDRNILLHLNSLIRIKSLSARRAWIEINAIVAVFQLLIVALRKESVDRNKTFKILPKQLNRRSPQGERG